MTVLTTSGAAAGYVPGGDRFVPPQDWVWPDLVPLLANVRANTYALSTVYEGASLKRCASLGNGQTPLATEAALKAEETMRLTLVDAMNGLCVVSAALADMTNEITGAM